MVMDADGLFAYAGGEGRRVCMRQRLERAEASRSRPAMTSASRSRGPRPATRQVPSDDAVRRRLGGVEDRAGAPPGASFGHIVEAVRLGSPGAGATANAQPGAAAKPACEHGCAQRWGQDTTCSKWGFRVGQAE